MESGSLSLLRKLSAHEMSRSREVSRWVRVLPGPREPDEIRFLGVSAMRKLLADETGRPSALMSTRSPACGARPMLRVVLSGVMSAPRVRNPIGGPAQWR